MVRPRRAPIRSLLTEWLNLTRRTRLCGAHADSRPGPVRTSTLVMFTVRIATRTSSAVYRHSGNCGSGVNMGAGHLAAVWAVAVTNGVVMAGALLQLLGRRPLQDTQVMLLALALLAVPPLIASTAVQRRAARAARDRQLALDTRWDLVQRHSQDLFWEIDPAGVLTDVSQLTAHTLGTVPELLTGRDILSLVHPEDAERTRRLYGACVRRQIGWDHVRVRALRADGAAVELDSSGAAVRSSAGRAGFVATAHVVNQDAAAQHAHQRKQQRIQAVLTEGTLTTVLQPIFSLHTGRVVGVEALSRFPGHPRQGPDAWFADAHEVGLGTALEVLAIETALRKAAMVSADIYIAVNVSPTTVTSAALHRAVTAGPVPASRIVLELTEHVFVEDYHELGDAMIDLRAHGARLAIDDAGAGFASFRHILRLQPDVIKIDQGITREINTQPAHRALTAAMVMFALEVGSTTIVAEGVETADELRTIASLGIDAAQGYHLGRPTATETAWAAIEDLTSFTMAAAHA